MARRKPRSPGVMLRGRSLGTHYYDDETRADGGKPFLHRQVRRTERDALRRDVQDAIADRAEADGETAVQAPDCDPYAAERHMRQLAIDLFQKAGRRQAMKLLTGPVL